MSDCCITPIQQFVGYIIASSQQLVSYIIASSQQLVSYIIASSQQLVSYIIASSQQFVSYIIASSQQLVSYIMASSQQLVSYTIASRTSYFSMRSWWWWWGPLCTIPTHLIGSFFSIVLAHWNNSTRVGVSFQSDTLFWFRANQSLLFLLNAACFAEKQQIPIL